MIPRRLPIWATRSAILVALFVIGLGVVWKIALSRPAELRDEIQEHTTQIANLEAFLRANAESLRLADRIRIEEITRWVPSDLSPHEAKARILASAVQHGVVIENLTIEEVRSLRGDTVSTLQDLPVTEEANATLLPEEIEAMNGGEPGTTRAPPPPIEAEPILGQPFSVSGQAGFLPLMDWLAQLKEGSPLAAITALTLDRIPASEQTRQSFRSGPQERTVQFRMQIVYGYRPTANGKRGGER